MNVISKNFVRLVLCLCVAFAGQSCVVVAKPKTASSSNKPLPPGQAKKVTGSQSAKSYAPGQQKKKN